MLRRLHAQQPESFAFTLANQRWAEAQISKYPEGRQASAIIPLLWRAQEQEGWLSRPAMEHVADMLGLAHIRALEVATFYFMFQLQPVGSVAHVQICGTTSCMICGAEDLVAVCREKIAPKPHVLSADGKLSWEEVECLGACSNAPMAQIGKDYYEDLTAESLGQILDEIVAGRVPTPGPQNGRFSSEPASGLTSLDGDGQRVEANASVALAAEIGDTLKRIDGTEVELRTPWREHVPSEQPGPERGDHLQPSGMPEDEPTPGPQPSAGVPADETGVTKQEAQASEAGHPAAAAPAQAATAESARDAATGHSRAFEPEPTVAETAPGGREPVRLDAARDEGADDLTQLADIDAALQTRLNEIGIFHRDQVAAWGDEEAAWVASKLDVGRERVFGWAEAARQVPAGGS
ncbi:NADH-quinone oxidoreductase subunit NuoE [Roseitranquillus sediminis]|uniref:NADH-quinone oxidoreductase subunit NuoE n=1 Tax=Roseitranquillus sediminis TaxID=2809051 RepID=UPI001D0C5B22|nr:NADH-quinone oxidoreductase subunit NuoE [Roseitranquillus sediminis]MBM9594110.1 NADH-quinone oxidoreductase subunit NuoE [Roseitranquillus sediminis]